MTRIQKELDDGVNTWNNHKLSTEGNKTPLQLMNLRSNMFQNPLNVDEDYGMIDEEDMEEETDHQVKCF